MYTHIYTPHRDVHEHNSMMNCNQMAELRFKIHTLASFGHAANDCGAHLIELIISDQCENAKNLPAQKLPPSPPLSRDRKR